MKISQAGVLEIAEHEGIVLGPYLDERGIWTYGVGHTAAAGGLDPAGLPRTDTRALPDERARLEMIEALRLFDRDLDSYEGRVTRAIARPLKQHQFDALVSWDFNTGGATWRSSSGRPCQLVSEVNAGDMSGAGFMGWLKPKSLHGRRKAERALFRTGDYAANGDSIPVYDALPDGSTRRRGSVSGAELARLMGAAGSFRRPRPRPMWRRLLSSLWPW